MAHFTRRISEMEALHGRALNEDITDEFLDNPYEAYTLAVGFSIATLPGSFSDAAERAPGRWPQ
jgi:hypothetical protein